MMKTQKRFIKLLMKHAMPSFVLFGGVIGFFLYDISRALSAETLGWYIAFAFAVIGIIWSLWGVIDYEFGGA